MATYFTDFSEYSTGSQPSDWTARYAASPVWTVTADAGATGGNVLAYSGTANALNLLSWDEIDSDVGRDDVEIVSRFRVVGSTKPQVNLVCRASGSAPFSDTFHYEAGLIDGDDEFRIGKLSPGFSKIASVAETVVQDTWYWARFRVIGTSLKMKLWLDTESEPGTWDIDTTDSDVTGVGWVGIGVFWDDPMEVDLFGVGTDGDTAPTSAGSPAITGSGSLEAQRATVSGTGTVTSTITGLGSLEAQRANVSGSGTINKTGTGALEAQRATVSGSGTVFSTITGSGSLEAQRATVSGAGLLDIAHVNSTKAVAASSSVTSITTNKPAGAAEDDFALFVTSADGGVGITLPTGVTEIFQGDVPSSAVGATRIAIGYKILGPSEPADYTSTLSSNDGCTMSCSVWRNVDTSTPLDVAFDHTVLNSSTDPCPPCPSVTTISDRTALITLASAPRGPSAATMDAEDMYTPPGGVTEVVDANYAAGTSYAGHGIGWETIAEAGATGTRTWAYIDNDEGGFAGTLALRQAGATVTSDKTGSGTLEAQRATITGSGTIGREATGTLEAQRATVSGSGTVTSTITGTGSLEASQATVSGSGTVTSTITGSGSLEAQRAVVAGSGNVSEPGAGATGSGSLEASQATVSGTGKITKTGSGTLEAQRATLEGLGTAFSTITGTGSLEASRAVLEATGEAYKTAAGALVASRATVAGTGNVTLAPITGTGTLQASNAEVTATIKRTIIGAGTLSASQASLSAFLWIEFHTSTQVWVDGEPQEPTWTEQDTPDSGPWS